MSKRIIIALLFILFTIPTYAANIVRLGPEYFPQDDKGRPISFADIYVGEPDTDPKTPANQKTLSVLQENGALVAVSQPLNTGSGGVPLYNGSPVTMYVEGDYSLRIDNSSGSQIYYVPSALSQADPVTGGNFYYPDYTVTNQAVDGDDNSFEDLKGQIGTDFATIYARHNSGLSETVYNFGSIWSGVSNITFKLERGAHIRPSSGVTVDLGVLAHEVIGREGQIYDISLGGVILFSDGGTVWSESFGSSPNDGIDDYTAVQGAMNSIDTTNGGTLETLGMYTMGTTGLIPSYVTIKGSSNRVSGFEADVALDAYVLRNKSWVAAEAGTVVLDTDIVLDNIFIWGNRVNQTTSGGGVKFSGVTNFEIVKCKVSNAFNDNIFILNSNGKISGNLSLDAGADCYTIHDSEHVLFTENTGELSGQRIGTVGGGGVLTIVDSNSVGVVINDNILRKANFGFTSGDYSGGQDFGNGISLNNSAHCQITSNNIDLCTQAGIRANQTGNGIHLLSDNVIWDCGNRGIYVLSPLTTVEGNNISGITSHGISTATTSLRTSLIGNTIHDVTGEGIEVKANQMIVSTNMVSFTGNNGILLDSVERCIVSINTAREYDQNRGDLFSGIRIKDSARNSISVNNIFNTTQSGSTTENNYGIYTTGASSANNNISLNVLHDNEDGNIAYASGLGSTDTLIGNDTDDAVSIASGATVTLPMSGTWFTISGTTGITAIEGHWVGREVTLKFDSGVTVTDGGDLKLEGDFNSTANDTLHMVSGGAAWFEKGRSAN